MAIEVRWGRVAAMLLLPLLLGAGFLTGGQPKAFRQAITGDMASVDRYLEREKRHLYTDHSGRTVLHWLVGYGHVDAVDRYLDTGIDVNLRLNRADAFGPVLKKRLDTLELADVTLLTLAAFGGQRDVAARLLERGADVDGAGSTGTTALLAAAQWGDSATVELLLEHGAATESRNSLGLTPLLAAILGIRDPYTAGLFMAAQPRPSPESASPVATVERLLRHGADAHAVSIGDENGLYLAAFKGNRALVDLLLQHDVDPNVRMSEGRNSAHLAASMDHIEIARRLVEHGAEPVVVTKLIRDFHGTAVLHDLVGQRAEATGDRRAALDMYRIAAEHFSKAAWQCRTEADRRATAARRSAFWSAAARGAYDGLVAINADIQARQMGQISALSGAARSGAGLGGYYALLDAQAGSTSGQSGAGSYAFNQSLPDEKWTDVYAARAVMAQRAAAQMYLALEDRFADLLGAPPADRLERFLLTTRIQWLAGALNPLSDEFERSAAVSRPEFVDVYSPEIASLFATANGKRVVDAEEFLVGHGADAFLLTNQALYPMADGQPAIELGTVVDYRIKGGAIVRLADGREIVLDGLATVPSEEAMRLLVPGLSEQS